MEDFEEKIRGCRESFNDEMPPEGDFGRFEKRLAGRTREAGHRRVVIKRWIVAAAACIVVALTVGASVFFTERRYNRGPAVDNDAYAYFLDYMKKVSELNRQIALMSCKMSYKDYHQINAALNSITSEKVPMEEQLPAALSKEEKAKILSEYYGLKLEAAGNLAEYAKKITENQ